MRVKTKGFSNNKSYDLESEIFKTPKKTFKKILRTLPAYTLEGLETQLFFNELDNGDGDSEYWINYACERGCCACCGCSCNDYYDFDEEDTE